MPGHGAAMAGGDAVRRIVTPECGMGDEPGSHAMRGRAAILPKRE